MEKGVHPLDQRYIDAYASRAESSPDCMATLPSPVRCPLCDGPLERSARRRQGYRYFAHREKADGERCPLSTSSYQLLGMLVGCERNPLVEVEHRMRFLDAWQRHYRIARSLAPMLTLERFAALIKYADVVNLWSHPALDRRDLPYVLLVMAGFMTSRDANGEVTRVRFWFDGSVQHVSDLWRASRTQKPELYRIVYRDPLHTPFPTSAHILCWERVAQATRVADTGVPRLSRDEVQLFTRMMEVHDLERRLTQADDEIA
ncbi:hypothetical protein GCM10027093_63360 [Paraburkholderia jirisanensis]